MVFNHLSYYLLICLFIVRLEEELTKEEEEACSRKRASPGVKFGLGIERNSIMCRPVMHALIQEQQGILTGFRALKGFGLVFLLDVSNHGVERDCRMQGQRQNKGYSRDNVVGSGEEPSGQWAE